jgi:hypothetical protein
MRIVRPLINKEAKNKVEYTTYVFGTQVELYRCTVTLIQIREAGRLPYIYFCWKIDCVITK